jgi:ribose 1,5-bisphosphokinase
VLNWLVTHWNDSTPLYRARRTITRAAEAGGEPHEPVCQAEFERLRDAGLFAWHWTAHGLHYGVRHSELAALGTGGLVMVNGSRGHLTDAIARFKTMAVLHITASEATLLARLNARQRETPEDISQRIQRTRQLAPVTVPQSLTVHNDGSLEAAGEQVHRWLQRWLHHPASTQSAPARSTRHKLESASS